MQRIKAARPQGGIRVVCEEKYRKVLRHPNGTGFPADGGSAEWPNDRFTKRRIAEGAIKREDTNKKEQSSHRPARHHQSAQTSGE
jgi:hypothetical protein